MIEKEQERGRKKRRRVEIEALTDWKFIRQNEAKRVGEEHGGKYRHQGGVTALTAPGE